MKSLEKRILSLEKFRRKSLELAQQLFEDIDNPAILNDLQEEDSDTGSSKSVEEEDVIIQMNVAKPVISLVWPLLCDWILSKDSEGNRRGSFGKFLKLIDAKNVRQILFQRDLKAVEKYGRGLSFEDGKNFEAGVNRLADSVYFLYASIKDVETTSKENPHEFARNLSLLSDLHNIVGTLISDLKLYKFKINS